MRRRDGRSTIRPRDPLPSFAALAAGRHGRPRRLTPRCGYCRIAPSGGVERDRREQGRISYANIVTFVTASRGRTGNPSACAAICRNSAQQRPCSAREPRPEARPGHKAAGECSRTRSVAAHKRSLSPFTGSCRPAAQPSSIGYLAKIASVRLNALSIAACGVTPLLIVSRIARANTCSVETCARAGL
jgi:hypothetical protein